MTTEPKSPDTSDTITNRKLDVWVALYLWKCSISHFDDSADGFYAQCSLAPHYNHICPADGMSLGGPSDATINRIPDFTSDISKSWLIVEKMRERGYVLMLYNSHAHEEWVAYFQLEDATTPRGHLDTSAPRAICLAAKAALEGET